MKKGSEESIILVLAVIFGVFSVALFWLAFGGSTPPQVEKPSGPLAPCSGDADCPNNQKCLQVYPRNFTPFCGCLYNEDCDGGNSICTSENSCVPCSCTDWRNTTCGESPCSSVEMKQIRECSNKECTESRCINC